MTHKTSPATRARDLDLSRAALHNIPITDVADRFGLTLYHTRKIVLRTLKTCAEPRIDPSLQSHRRDSIATAKRHKNYWPARLDRLAEHWRRRPGDNTPDLDP